MTGANAEIGEKGKLFIQFSFSSLPQESKFSDQNSYHRGPFCWLRSTKPDGRLSALGAQRPGYDTVSVQPRRPV